MLGGWFNANNRLHLKLNRARAALENCKALPPRERFSALLKVEDRFGDVFLAGDDIRLAIVATGVSEAVPWIKLLAQTPVLGRRSVTGGIAAALASGEAEEDYKVQMFQLLVDHLQHMRFSCTELRTAAIPDLLLQLDRDWAVRVLNHPEYLTPGYAHFFELLEALERHEVAVEHSSLLQWLPQYRDQTLNCTTGRIYTKILELLHGYEPEKAEQLLTQVMNTQPEAAVTAAEALLHLRDLPHPRFTLDDWCSKAGLDALSQAEQTAWLVDQYNYRMSCGGLDALEYNVEDGHLPLMHEALLKIGAVRAAARLREYMALYGPEGPAFTEAARAQQIAAQGEAWGSAREAIVQKYPDLEATELLVLQYELDHADQFRKLSELRINKQQII